MFHAVALQWYPPKAGPTAASWGSGQNRRSDEPCRIPQPGLHSSCSRHPGLQPELPRKFEQLAAEAVISLMLPSRPASRAPISGYQHWSDHPVYDLRRDRPVAPSSRSPARSARTRVTDPPASDLLGPVLLQRLALVADHLREGSDHVSGVDLEQCGDELRPGHDVVATDVPNLPLPDHRHRLVACQCSSRRPEAAKAPSGADQSFHDPVVLLNDIVQVFHLAQP